MVIMTQTPAVVVHVAMFPWFAMGHIGPYLQVANKFAERGHRVSFFIPLKTKDRVKHLNLHPHLIHFIPITMPQVDGLPPGVETTADAAAHLGPLISVAFDSTQDQLSLSLQNLKPDLIFYDFSHWLPSLARSLGIKPFFFAISSAVSNALLLVPSRKKQMTSVIDLREPPPGFPSSSSIMHQRPFEARDEIWFSSEFHGRMSFYDRLTSCIREGDAACFRACHEIEGPFCDYLSNQYDNKPVLLMGAVLPEATTAIKLEEKWEKWLGGFEKGSVVYCAFGSECELKKEQFQELVLGLELTGLPFLARLSPPMGCKTVEEALPEGFEERVRGRGVVHGGWMQQQLILSHPSVGCFVSHSGPASIWEALVSDAQIVVVPYRGDQFVVAKFVAREIKVGVEVERREEDGWYTREDVCKVLKVVMDQGSQLGDQVRANHQKWKDFLLTPGLDKSYFDNFIIKLQDLVNSK